MLNCPYSYLAAQKTMAGSHSGANLAWTFWESLGKRGMLKQLFSITGNNSANNISMVAAIEQKYHGIITTWPQEECFHRCAFHVLNLVAKEVLDNMDQLTDEDYAFFDDYLAVQLAPIADSKDEEAPTPKEIRGTLNHVQKKSDYSQNKRHARSVNQSTLETQDKSGDLQHVNDAKFTFYESDGNTGLHTQLITGNKTIVCSLCNLCSHICGASKQREEFINAYNQTSNPKLLPINILMTRWNYFLLQIKWAEALKLSIQLYTATPEGAKYELSDEVWSAMELMFTILELIEQSCNVFQ
ncbi:hypothetical protein O181_023938 [Austropuccinia psidii MF-1]|uniref:Uncharacterized protein n=1 Tax=Austropuccinia psidii MF-1 TaxID=1389203 RepID=A0A9Q3GXR5_9BASI|nr:hypothetical protein [Austropuccinia psidii MF-1]